MYEFTVVRNGVMVYHQKHVDFRLLFVLLNALDFNPHSDTCYLRFSRK